MRSWIYLVPATGFAYAAATLMASLIPHSTESELWVANELHDFGTVRQGESLEAIFTLVNKSRHRIDIRRKDTSCNCTAILSTGSDRIAPGESMPLTATMDTHNRSGQISNSVDVAYSSSDNKNLRSRRLRLTATVTPDYVITPPILIFSRLSTTPISQKITFAPVGMQDLTIIELHASNKAFAVTNATRDEATGNLSITIRFTPAEYLEPFRNSSHIDVSTNSRGQPTAKVPLIISQ